MNNLIIFFVSVACLALSACSSVHKDRQQELSVWSDFTAKTTIPFTDFVKRDDGGIVFMNFDKTTIEQSPKDVLILLYHFSPSKGCQNEIIGTSTTANLDVPGSQTKWGKVDFYDIYGSRNGFIDYSGPNPLCFPLGANGYSYGLCSERKDVSVVICIGEATDNPTLARQIFETFKWTK